VRHDRCMMLAHWADLATIMGAFLTPLMVGVVGFFFVRRQSRSEQLQRIRLDYYQELLPELNRLMCYMTFIGTWRANSPLDIVRVKRRLDARFVCASPLFSLPG